MLAFDSNLENGSQELEGWQHLATGKVRELYLPKGEHPLGDVVLVVASDRISAFDYVLDSQIPGKGEVLTKMSIFWFGLIKRELGIPTHYITSDGVPNAVKGRAIICKRLEMLPVECVARGYLTGSAFEEYQQTGKYQEFDLPAGLSDGSQLASPLFTPAAKAEVGDHDENITFEKVTELVGKARANQLREKTLQIYELGAKVAFRAGITLIDTKFEFGIDPKTQALTLGDEVLTPDSSRFFNTEGESYDKQFVRNWLLNQSGWSKTSGEKPPALPQEIIAKTASLYQEAYERLAGA